MRCYCKQLGQRRSHKNLWQLGMGLAFILLVMPSTPLSGQDSINIDFDQVDIRTVIKTIGELTGTNFVVDEKVSGNVTVVSPRPVPLSDVYRLLESILEVHGLAAVPAGNVVKVVPKNQAVRQRLPVRVGSDPNQIPLDDSLVTQIIPLRYAKAAELAVALQSLLSQDGKIIGYGKGNALLVTDTSARIHYIATVVSMLDTEQAAEQAKVFSLRYADPQTLAELISRIMQRSSGTSARSSSTTDAELRILPDTRTNSLAVIGTGADLQVVSQLVEQFDVPRPEGMEQLHVVYLKNATAKEVAKSLTAALSGLRITTNDSKEAVQVTADEGTNSLIIAADSQQLPSVLKIVEMLDVVQEQVLVEMLIVEVSQERLDALGIDWATMDDPVSGGVRGFGATNLGPRVEFLSGDL
ncbi:MAG: secretin N-terminal domain-containing protein, partial [Sedimentisphaerales bacterium]|nr:secretin N-terminal domain-containing protein [Sedimentisphaerales bacterium]